MPTKMAVAVLCWVHFDLSCIHLRALFCQLFGRPDRLICGEHKTVQVIEWAPLVGGRTRAEITPARLNELSQIGTPSSECMFRRKDLYVSRCECEITECGVVICV